MSETPKLKSNIEWKQWGREDPLWGVLSWAGRQKEGATPWTEEEFYALGESDFEDFWRHWQRYGVTRESCLEIGCGAGRITRPLAQTFREVKAVDVSEDMLALAMKAVGSNVSFAMVDGLTLPFGDAAVDAIFSVLVLQHLDNVDAGLAYMREFFRVLKPGGTMMVQIPLYRFPYSGRRMRNAMEMLHTLSRKVGGVLADRKRRAGIKMMRVTPYDLDDLRGHLVQTGFRDVEFQMFATKSNDDLYSFAFATRPNRI